MDLLLFATKIEPVIPVLVLGAELMSNEGFEMGNDLQWWVKTPVDGSLGQTSVLDEVHTGTIAAKLTAGATLPSDCRISQDNPTTPGADYVMSFWTRGDGVNAGAYMMYDRISGLDIVARVSTGISDVAWQQIIVRFTAPVNCTNVRTIFYAPATGGSAYYDDTSFKPVL